MIVSDRLATALVTAAFPTVAVLVGILINNQRLNDTNRHIDDVKELLRAEMYRMEQVIDARLKHLEEHLAR